VAFVGLSYELVNADGTRVVFGNSDAARADADFIGTLTPDSGITGLLDAATVRESSSDLVERDGASFGSFWLSRRSGTIDGMLRPDLLDTITVATAEQKLKRATRALRGDAVLRWTPPDASSPRQLRVRRQDGPHITGRRPKRWQITLVSADVYALGSTEQHATITAGAAAGEVGILNPITNPISSATSATGQQSVVNDGDAPTWPRFRVTGPITNPTILNNSTGEQIVLAYSLAASEYLDVYPQRGVILAQGTADRYSALDFAQSEWWQLQPGTTDVRLLASSFSSPAALDVYWQPAYE
jgi:tail protein